MSRVESASPALPMTSTTILDQRMDRVDSLTGLRWWAAFAVFAYHMIEFAALPPLATTFLSFGFLGVTFFFVLSGFVLTWSLSNRISQSTFYWRRFARIYPSHIAALLIAIPVFTSLNPNPHLPWVNVFNIGVLGLSVVLLQGWFSNTAILFSGNPAAWTLSCEAFFYALHPYISRALGRLRVRGSLLFAVGAFVLTLIYRFVAGAMPHAWFAHLPLPVVDLPEFAIGMALAWAFRCGWRPRIPVTLGIGLLLGSIAALALSQHFALTSPVTISFGAYSNELFTVVCAVAIVAFAGRSLNNRRSILASRPMVVLGEWSYAFYLVHATFIYLAVDFLGRREASWFNLLWYAALLVICLTAAAGLHYGVERPLEKRLRAWKDARTIH